MQERVTQAVHEMIFVLRNQKVMLDRDLAQLYGVSTKRLNEQVKRNIKRFPPDFMFRLTAAELEQLVAKCDRLKALKHSSVTPHAFTEHGVAMLSSVLNSERAVQVNIVVIRAFIRMREMLNIHKELAANLKNLEGKVDKQDREIQAIFRAIQQLVMQPDKPKSRIGFRPA